MPAFTCDIHLNQGLMIVRTNGYIDKISGEGVEKQCQEKLTENPKVLVLNFTGSPIINSSGMSHILDTIGAFSEQNEIPVWICGLSVLARSAFRTCGLLDIAKEAPTEAEALVQIEKAKG
jgi:anti-anti-sigma factor